MARKHTADNDRAEGDPALERHVHEALKAMGWLTPESEAEVQSAEAEVSPEVVPLPAILRDADAVLDRRAGGSAAGSGSGGKPRAFPFSADADEHLARAARAGSPIPPSIEEQMRRDRQAAEDELDRSDDGKAVR